MKTAMEKTNRRMFFRIWLSFASGCTYLSDSWSSCFPGVGCSCFSATAPSAGDVESIIVSGVV